MVSFDVVSLFISVPLYKALYIISKKLLSDCTKLTLDDIFEQESATLCMLQAKEQLYNVMVNCTFFHLPKPFFY